MTWTARYCNIPITLVFLKFIWRGLQIQSKLVCVSFNLSDRGNHTRQAASFATLSSTRLPRQNCTYSKDTLALFASKGGIRRMISERASKSIFQQGPGKRDSNSVLAIRAVDWSCKWRSYMQNTAANLENICTGPVKHVPARPVKEMVKLVKTGETISKGGISASFDLYFVKFITATYACKNRHFLCRTWAVGNSTSRLLSSQHSLQLLIQKASKAETMCQNTPPEVQFRLWTTDEEKEWQSLSEPKQASSRLEMHSQPWHWIMSVISSHDGGRAPNSSSFLQASGFSVRTLEPIRKPSETFIPPAVMLSNQLPWCMDFESFIGNGLEKLIMSWRWHEAWERVAKLSH